MSSPAQTLPAASPKRVLFVSPTARAGTAQYTHNLASHLARNGHQVSLLTGVGYELGRYARDYTVLEAIDRFRPRPLLWWRLWRHLRKLRPQVIHYQGGQHPDMLWLLDRALRLLFPAAAVYTPQDLHSNNRRKHHDKAAQALLKRMQHIFFNSEENRGFVRRSWAIDVDHSSVAAVPDLLEFVRRDVKAEPPAIPAGRALILCFGLIEPRKGIATLLEAFARLRQTRPNTHLAVVGKPFMDLAPLHETIARHGMREHVSLVAEYVSFERMAGWFERADTVVLPYESGWNSGVIPVALGYAKPVVATTIASAAEAVIHEETGLLIPPSDVEALSQALLRVLDDRELRDRMQPLLRQAAIDQGWSSLVRATETVYQRLVPA